jgi:two-component sensor histidine kinase
MKLKQYELDVVVREIDTQIQTISLENDKSFLPEESKQIQKMSDAIEALEKKVRDAKQKKYEYMTSIQDKHKCYYSAGDKMFRRSPNVRNYMSIRDRVVLAQIKSDDISEVIDSIVKELTK